MGPMLEERKLGTLSVLRSPPASGGWKIFVLKALSIRFRKKLSRTSIQKPLAPHSNFPSQSAAVSLLWSSDDPRAYAQSEHLALQEFDVS